MRATETLKVGDIEVAYRAEGEGATTMVLIHGLAQDHRMWAHQQASLAGVSTVACDIRGHGETSLGDPDGTLSQLGGDLVAFLEHVGPATCAGFSLGGTVALWAAAERPDLVESVVALATSSVVGRAAAAFFAQRIRLFAGDDTEAIRQALLADTRGALANPRVDADGVTATRLQAIGDRRGYLNGARAMAAIHEEPLNPRLARVECPVLVVSGERDTFCPRKAAEIMLEHLPNARFEELSGIGHLVTDDGPEAVTSVIERWIAGARAA